MFRKNTLQAVIKGEIQPIVESMQAGIQRIINITVHARTDMFGKRTLSDHRPAQKQELRILSLQAEVPVQEGVYTGQCAELCGRNHANMTARVRAVTPDEFTQWLAQQQADLVTSAQGAEAYRAEQQRLDQQGAAPAPAEDAAPGEAGASGDTPASPTTTNPEATANDAASQR